MATPITFARPSLFNTVGSTQSVQSLSVVTAEDGSCRPLPPPAYSISRESGSTDSQDSAVVAAVQSSETDLVSSSLNSGAATLIPSSILPITTSSSGSVLLPTFRWTGPPIVTTKSSSPASSLVPHLPIAVPTPPVAAKNKS